METLTMTGKVSEGGKLTFNLPPHFAGWMIEATLHFEAPPNEKCDSNGWPIGFFEEFAGCIPDFEFQRSSQKKAGTAAEKTEDEST